MSSSRKEFASKSRDPATDYEDILLVVPPRTPPAALVRRRTGPPVWQDPTARLEQEVSKDSRERAEDTSIFGNKAECEGLRNIMHKISQERNLRDHHLKHYHMSTAKFKKRTTHLDILEKKKTSINTW